jgi:actin related protein 2/3 complex subunit 1A/1B
VKDLFVYEGISHLCFNKDYTKCALSKKNNIIYIYQIKSLNAPSKWIELQQLKNHDLYVSGLDWNAETDKIISCSYDKTCKIWTFDGKI